MLCHKNIYSVFQYNTNKKKNIKNYIMNKKYVCIKHLYMY